jgi:hypothetical protein
VDLGFQGYERLFVPMLLAPEEHHNGTVNASLLEAGFWNKMWNELKVLSECWSTLTVRHHAEH